MGLLPFRRWLASRRSGASVTRPLRLEQLENRRLLAANLVPKAVEDSATTLGNVPILVNLVSNDYDRDGSIDLASIAITSGPNAGKVEVRVDGQIKYTPPRDRLGIDSFAYSVRDDAGAVSNSASVSIVVRSAYQNPRVQQDVNNDGMKTPLDVLQVIAELNSGGARQLPHPPPQSLAPPPYVDVTGDGWLTPADAKLAIECLNGIFGGRGSSACRVEPPPPLRDSGTEKPVDTTIPDEVLPDVTETSDPPTDSDLEQEPREESEDLIDAPEEVIVRAESDFPDLRSLTARHSIIAWDGSELEHPLLPGGLSDLENLG
ncbi:MAG: Ig-like domain-containing protein [Pirellulaceae bacterium]